MSQYPFHLVSRSVLIVLICSVLAIIDSNACRAEEYDGFTEPYQAVRVASPESGIIQTVHVREGDTVQVGQILARLDDELHLAMLAIAQETMDATGGVKSAVAELQLQQRRLAKLKAAREQGYARQEEVDRTAADVEIFGARVQSAKESQLIKKREYDKIKIQVQRRIIRAPLDGIVKQIHKRKGEYVGPNDPYVLDLVKLNPLIAKFSLPSQRGRQLHEDQAVTVYLEPLGTTTRAFIEFIGPVTDAESGTVQIKAHINNQKGQFFSGEQCILQLKARRPAIAKATSVSLKSN